MKKLKIMLSLSLIFVFGICGFTYGETFILTSGQCEQNVGKCVYVATSVYDIIHTDLTAFQFTLNYDPEKLELISNSVQGMVYENPYQSVNSAVYGKVDAMLAYPGPEYAINGESQLFTSIFRVRADGTDTLTITSPLISDKEGNLITPSTESLTINLWKQYDVNGDGLINLGDIGIVAYSVGGGSTKYDQNLDGAVNYTDLELIRQSMSL